MRGPHRDSPPGPSSPSATPTRFYSVVLTDLPLSLGSAGLFVPRWTERIHGEWFGSILSDRPDLDPEKVARRREQMDAAIEDSLIEGYGAPDPGPESARRRRPACVGRRDPRGASMILTYNLRDFPRAALAGHGVAARHPDDFLGELFGTRPAEVTDVLEEMRSRKTRPAISRAELLSKLARQRLPAFVGMIRASGYADAETNPPGGGGGEGTDG